MNISKNCPQCGATFLGRSNKLYCSDRCKMEAFRSGTTRSTTSITKHTIDTSLISEPLSTTIPMPTIQLRDTTSVETQLELERLRLAHELKLRQLDQAERQEQREHERQMLEQTQAQQDDILIDRLKEMEARLEQSSKATNTFSLTDFPKPYQKQFKELVQTLLQAYDEPYDFEDYDDWLDTFRPFKEAVGKLVNEQQPTRPLCASMHKVLEEVEPLVQELRDDLYQESHRWKKEKSTLPISKDLRRLLRSFI